MEKTWTYRELELREEIAQLIEGNTISWGKFEDGIPLHTNCWKCNTEPMTRTCDDARESWSRDIAKVFANLVRNNK